MPGGIIQILIKATLEMHNMQKCIGRTTFWGFYAGNWTKIFAPSAGPLWIHYSAVVLASFSLNLVFSIYAVHFSTLGIL